MLVIKQNVQTWYIKEIHDTLFILGLPTPQWWQHPQWSQVNSGCFTISLNTVACWDLDMINLLFPFIRFYFTSSTTHLQKLLISVASANHNYI
jgi:hypothetical protein